MQLPVWSGLSANKVDKMSGRNKVLDHALEKMLIYIVFPPKKDENPQRVDWHMLKMEVYVISEIRCGWSDHIKCEVSAFFNVSNLSMVMVRN